MARKLSMSTNVPSLNKAYSFEVTIIILLTLQIVASKVCNKHLKCFISNIYLTKITHTYNTEMESSRSNNPTGISVICIQTFRSGTLIMPGIRSLLLGRRRKEGNIYFNSRRRKNDTAISKSRKGIKEI